MPNQIQNSKTLIRTTSAFIFYFIFSIGRIKAATMSEWGYPVNPQNIPSNKNSVIDNILGVGAFFSTLMIAYGLIKFILAIIKKDTKKRYESQKIIVYGFILSLVTGFIMFMTLIGNSHPLGN